MRNFDAITFKPEDLVDALLEVFEVSGCSVCKYQDGKWCSKPTELDDPDCEYTALIEYLEREYRGTKK